MNNRHFLKLKSQSGVTLLIAVLVMAGLTLITLAIGAFAIQEIRSSRAVVLTEPAIGAAESGGEEGLWSIKRGTVLPGSSNLGNGVLLNSSISYSSATFNLKAGVPFVFYLYDPNNINSNLCNTVGFNPCSGAQYYQNISIIHQSGTLLVNAQVVTVDGVSVASQSVNPGSSISIPIPASVPGSSDLRFKITLTTAADATVNVNTNQGMPTFPTVDSTGCSSRTSVSDCNSANQEIYSRRVNVTVPQ